MLTALSGSNSFFGILINPQHCYFKLMTFRIVFPFHGLCFVLKMELGTVVHYILHKHNRLMLYYSTGVSIYAKSYNFYTIYHYK